MSDNMSYIISNLPRMIGLLLCLAFKKIYKKWLSEDDTVIKVKGINKAIVENKDGDRKTVTIWFKFKPIVTYDFSKKDKQK